MCGWSSARGRSRRLRGDLASRRGALPAAEAPTLAWAPVGLQWPGRLPRRRPSGTRRTRSPPSGPTGITVTVTAEGIGGAMSSRHEKWSAPGVVLAGHGLRERDAPLRSCRSFATSFRCAGRDVEPAGRRPQQAAAPYRAHHSPRHASGGYEKVATPAGTFDAIRLRVIMQLDDETFWRIATNATTSSGMRRRSARPSGRRRGRSGAKRAGSDSVTPVRTHHALRGLIAYIPGSPTSCTAHRRARSPRIRRPELESRAGARSSSSAPRLVQRVEVQSRRAAREQAGAKLGDDVEAERADRRGVVAVALELAADPARDLGAAGVGEARELRAARRSA